MDTSQIATAFEMLVDEFERAQAETNKNGGEAFLKKDYASVANLAEAAKRLGEYQAKIASLEEQWSGDRLFYPQMPAANGRRASQSRPRRSKHSASKP